MAPRAVVNAGDRYGKLTVICEAEPVGYSRRVWCLCSCGKSNVQLVFLGNLAEAKTTSCGCAKGQYDRASTTTPVMEAKAQITDDGRLCFTCGVWQEWSQFGNVTRSSAHGLRGKRSKCNTCCNWDSKCSKYGMVRADFDYLLDIQNNVCAVCFEPEDMRYSTGVPLLSVDHDHKCCGKSKACKKCIRGLLCANCNDLIGRVEKRQILRGMFAVYLNARPLLHREG